MNDDDLTELILRASAYLDGELDAAETARAEADPAVMVEVEQLRALQADVRFVVPPTHAARESAVAAALATFDSLHDQAARPAPAAQPARVVPFTRRPAYTRWLTAAAAVMAVGVLGVVIANGAGGGDDDEAGDAALDATAATFDAQRNRTVEATAESAFAEEAATAEESAPAAELLEAPATIAAAESASEEAADAGGEAGSTMAPAASPTFDAERPIVDEFELGAAGAELLAREAAGTLGATPETRCDLDPYDELSFGQYQLDGDVRDVVIAVDRTSLRTAAYDADTCELVAESPAP